tara:strand:- start:211 stop:480 length:270 start_codon:yes stop_codon:yes gene_type:complete
MNKIIVTALILMFSFTNISFAATDCENPKGFHQKMVCKKLFKNKLKMPKLPKIGGNKTASAETGTESNTGIMKRLKAKTLKDMFFPKAE